MKQNNRKLRILIAEDNSINQLVARQTLEKLGHEVEIADNGREALEKATASDFDAILMDLEMPEMGGIESARCIRQLEEPRGAVRIVAMTGHALDENRKQCLEVGMDGFIPKPFDIVELNDALQATASLA